MRSKPTQPETAAKCSHWQYASSPASCKVQMDYLLDPVVSVNVLEPLHYFVLLSPQQLPHLSQVYAHCDGLQILVIELPQEYEASIVNTQAGDGGWFWAWGLEFGALGCDRRCSASGLCAHVCGCVGMRVWVCECGCGCTCFCWLMNMQ